MSKPGTVIGGPSISEGDIVCVVVDEDGKTAVPEAWRNGTWVRGAGDPAVTAFGRPLSAREIAALPNSSSR
jgi:hypothetical protein